VTISAPAGVYSFARLCAKEVPTDGNFSRRPALYMHVLMGMQACGVHVCSWARVRTWARQHLAQLLEDLVHFSPRILESRIFLQGRQGLLLAFMCV
jgi:hypothetical protein